jgi:hypothetical protein
MYDLTMFTGGEDTQTGVKIRELYTQRAALEREYATKLQALVRKAADKKAKMEQRIAVGPEPSKALDAGTLNSRCVTTCQFLLHTPDECWGHTKHTECRLR